MADFDRASESEKSTRLRAKLNEFGNGKHGLLFQPRELGVTWKELTVTGVSTGAAVHENIWSQWNLLRRIRDFLRKPPLRNILDNCHGCVKPGEMLLVLGRPGSGCTTLLNVLANRRRGYASIAGQVRYGSLQSTEADLYRGQILMSSDEDIFFPTLTVGQTMDFAAQLKIPPLLKADGVDKGSKDDAIDENFRASVRDLLLDSLGIRHTITTQVGNEFIRGVSGGERKRLSIAECLATRGSVFCWDNSTKGLDATSALTYIRTLRVLTDYLGLSSIVTLYQAGNSIYEMFDKVLVLDQGQEVYYGPVCEARPFMESLGFIHRSGASTSDFLTGVTVPTERQVCPENLASFPHTIKALRASYEQSSTYDQMRAERSYPESDLARERTVRFRQIVAQEGQSGGGGGSAFTASFLQQFRSCFIRQYQIIWGDKIGFIIRQAATLVLALLAGSLFYQAPDNSEGIYITSGALFFALLYNSITSMSEMSMAFPGRPVLIKHKSMALAHPTAFCVAQVLADVPLLALQITLFSLVLYFMAGLTMTAQAFFTYWAIVFVTSATMTALFRAVGAASSTFNEAAKWSGIILGAVNLYNGYMLTRHQMRPWLGWLIWINPLAYAFDALLSNELHDKTYECVGPNLIPSGPSYRDTNHQSCGGVGGAIRGHSSFTGDEYLQYRSYSHSHVWRNFGILWAAWALLMTLTMLATIRWKYAISNGSTSLLVPRERSKKASFALSGLSTSTASSTGSGSHVEEEANIASPKSPSGRPSPPVEEKSTVEKQQRPTHKMSLLTWNNLSYTIRSASGDRVLLDNVHGWVKPGKLGALMGVSGAGKTTLLDVLAQRKTQGIIRGSILVDGRPLPLAYQRCTGYCEQLDVHETFATVREALEFSALLRRDRSVPRQERLDYVDTIIDLLELNDIADAMIGNAEAGLTAEQKKRVTLGVELVAKPSSVIFLDEPTTGLDGQSAYNTVRFLRKLCSLGQSILVTVHQPSAQLFSQFDTLLLLQSGGKVAYFGDVGEDGAVVKDYFAQHGAPCPPDANPAEHIIDVVSGSLIKDRDWNSVWLQSTAYQAALEEMSRCQDEAITAEAAFLDTTKDEFATSLWTQIKIVTYRTTVSLFRNTDYVNNKLLLQVSSALFNSLTFFQLGRSVADLQSRQFTVFTFIFVAPGALNQLQPLFIERRNIFEARESKSKMYSWTAFVIATIISELPYLVAGAVLYFASWYYIVGFPSASSRAGGTLFDVIAYTFVYTAFGQFVAAIAPNAMTAALINPVIIGTLIPFCGILVPYHRIIAFWRYWLYYLNPFTYLAGSLVTFSAWGVPVECSESEFAYVNPPNGSTCGDYLSVYLSTNGQQSRLLNPNATSDCRVCQYRDGQDYLLNFNINSLGQAWMYSGISCIFILSSYALVFILMKARTARLLKKAKWEQAEVVDQ